MPLLDPLGRPLRSLRLSITDRCNLRCTYCMPGEHFSWLPRANILRFAEIERIARAFVALGVTRIRLTGGEPLIRRDLPNLVQRLASLPGVEDLALTTNGILLAPEARALADAGLRRITVSLDTLDPSRFRALTRHGEVALVRAGVEAAARAGLPIKLNAVILAGLNEDELVSLIEFGRGVASTTPVEVRFVEYMNVGDSTVWSPERVVTRAQILSRLEAHYGPPSPVPGRGSAPAERFRLPDGTLFGIVAATSAPFCGSCDRARLTADGFVYLCLHGREHLDLRAMVRGAANDETIKDCIRSAWARRVSRGAQALRRGRRGGRRLMLAGADTHREMHTRGG